MGSHDLRPVLGMSNSNSLENVKNRVLKISGYPLEVLLIKLSAVWYFAF